MNKLLTSLNKGMALIVVQCLILNPLALNQAQAFPHEGKYNSVCKPVLDASQEQKNADPSLGGVQASAACTNAKNAKSLHSVEIAKTILYSAAAVTLLTLALVDTVGKIIGMDVNTFCSALSMAVGAAAMGMDLGFKDAASVAVDHWVANAKPITSTLQTATSGIMALVGGKAASTAATGASKGAEQAGSKAGCWVGFGFAVVNAGLSGIGIHAAAEAIKKNLEVAASIRNNVSANPITGIGGPGKVQYAQAGMDGTAGVTQASECSSVQGDGYLSCINQEAQDPALSAMTSSKELMNTVGKALGMPVGDFIKGYSGDGSAGSIGAYVANGMGVPQLGQALGASIEKAKEKLASDPEFTSKYASKAAPKAGKKDPMADFNAMMKNMMGQLNPQNPKQKADPKVLIFRRLEAMSDDRILEAKDISLFDRITNRYQKKSSEPEVKAEAPTENR
jgi:hypothetical protein